MPHLQHCLLAILCWSAAASSVVAAERTNSFSDGSQRAPVYRVYTYKQPNGVPVFSDKAPAEQAFSIMEFSCYACNPSSKVDWSRVALHRSEYRTEIASAAQTHGVDPALVRAVIHAESGFNAHARSRKGAMGLMQLMPETARELGVDPSSPVQNIQGGVAYLAKMLEQFDGDIAMATAAYNAGPGAVSRFNGIPPYPETRTYVERVKLLHQRYRTLPAT